MGFNLSRVIGPVIADVVINIAGSEAVFVVNAISYSFVVVVLWQWQRTPTSINLPVERFLSAIKTGVRFVWHSQPLHAVFVKSLGNFVFATVTLALLHLVAR